MVSTPFGEINLPNPLAWLQSFVDTIYNSFKAGLDKITGAIGGFIDRIFDGITGLFSSFTDAVAAFFKMIGDTISTLITTVIGAVGFLITSLVGFLLDYWYIFLPIVVAGGAFVWFVFIRNPRKYPTNYDDIRREASTNTRQIMGGGQDLGKGLIGKGMV